MSKRVAFIVLRLAGQALAAAFVIWACWVAYRDWQGLPRGVNWLDVGWSALALIASNFLLAAAWIRLLHETTPVRAPTLWLFRVFSASNLGRYAPGKAALVAIRIGALSPLGVRTTAVATSMVLEIVSWMAGACVVSLALLSLSEPDGSVGHVLFDGVYLPSATARLLLVACIGCLVLLCRLSPQHLPQFMRRVFGSQRVEPLLSPVALLMHLGYWALCVVHGLLLLRGFGHGAFSAASAFVLAPVLGFLAFLTPAGAGVREAIVMAMVAPITGVSEATAISILSRLLSLVADLLSWVIAMVMARGQAPQPAVSDAESTP